MPLGHNNLQNKLHIHNCTHGLKETQFKTFYMSVQKTHARIIISIKHHNN